MLLYVTDVLVMQSTVLEQAGIGFTARTSAASYSLAVYFSPRRAAGGRPRQPRSASW